MKIIRPLSINKLAPFLFLGETLAVFYASYD
jgi:hypothetical protein